MITMATTTSPLLADPEQVADARALIYYARQAGATHELYQFGPRIGGARNSTEHTFTLGPARVIVHEGHLIYRRNGTIILSVKDVTTPRQVADLLNAVGVLPPGFASAYRQGRADGEWIHNPDTPPAYRKCKYCGATSGLKIVFSGLGYAAREYECWDGCRGRG